MGREKRKNVAGRSVSKMVREMPWVYDDGGRADAGFKGSTGDCVCRAVSIVTGEPYIDVYNYINELASKERKSKRQVKSSVRTGVRKSTTRKVFEHYGFKWIPTMKVGQGCKVHLVADELPKGSIAVSVSKHITAVIDGVIHDTYDPNDRGSQLDFIDGKPVDVSCNRCVYGYFIKEGAGR